MLWRRWPYVEGLLVLLRFFAPTPKSFCVASATLEWKKRRRKKKRKIEWKKNPWPCRAQAEEQEKELDDNNNNQDGKRREKEREKSAPLIFESGTLLLLSDPIWGAHFLSRQKKFSCARKRRGKPNPVTDKET